MKKLVLECEYCGPIAEWEGSDDLLHWAAEAFIEDHWRNHVPSVRYNWSTV